MGLTGPATHFAPSPRKLTRRGRLGSATLISVSVLAGVPAMVRQAYGERALERANRAAMLDIELIEDQDCFVPHMTVSTFIAAAARIAGEAEFGLLISPELTVARHGCWGRFVLGADTLGEAIGRVVATLGYHSRGDRMSLTLHDREARLSYLSVTRDLDDYRHMACATAGLIVSLCRPYLGPGWRPLRVELDIPEPRRRTRFEDVFGCPVTFDAPAIAVCLSPEALGAPRPRRGGEAPVTVEDVARARLDRGGGGGSLDVIAEQVWSQVLAGEVSAEGTARALGISVRSLQRELNREGAAFRALVTAARTRRAIELLRGTGMSVTGISTTLGYSAPAHFARAFRKATGLSPQDYRGAHRPGARG